MLKDAITLLKPKSDLEIIESLRLLCGSYFMSYSGDSYIKLISITDTINYVSLGSDINMYKSDLKMFKDFFKIERPLDAEMVKDFVEYEYKRYRKMLKDLPEFLKQ